jgi:hypothetical protein
MVHQGSRQKDGRYAGLFEFVFELPKEVPHFVRK